MSRSELWYILNCNILISYILLSVCVHGDIRLINGQTAYEGRVEVCLNNAWGTVCDDFWDNNDARVVCRQAGFSDQNATALQLSPFGQGTDPIVLDDVRCTGTESRLIDCPYTATHNCIHLEDAGVICQPCRFCLFFVQASTTLSKKKLSRNEPITVYKVVA